MEDDVQVSVCSTYSKSNRSGSVLRIWHSWTSRYAVRSPLDWSGSRISRATEETNFKCPDGVDFMMQKCSMCGVSYDDATSFTYCPHQQFLTPEQAKRKPAALLLLGKKVHFSHHTPENVHTVQCVHFDGLIEISGMTGRFSPHLFKVIEGK